MLFGAIRELMKNAPVAAINVSVRADAPEVQNR